MSRDISLHWNPARPFEITNGQSGITSSSYFGGFLMFVSFLMLFVLCLIDLSLKPLLILPAFLIIPIWQVIYVQLVHRDVYLKLRKIANAAQLIDYDQRRRTWNNRAEIVQSAIFDYIESKEQITVFIWPNGIQRSDKVEKLAKLLSTTFNTSMARINSYRMDCVVYCGYKTEGRLKVDNGDF